MNMDNRESNIRSSAADEEKSIKHLDGQLSEQRSPYLKARLKIALNSLADIEMLLRLEKEAQPQYVGAWFSVAEGSIATATRIREQVQQLIERYGGADKIVEVDS
jgi:hypothetical protein